MSGVFFPALQSLKSRGIKFPGRDLESLAPIFTPPQSISRSSTQGSGALGSRESGGGLAPTNPEDAKEIFDVSRNSVELLSTVLTSSPKQEALQVFFVFLLQL
jgi:hypothetical protein